MKWDMALDEEGMRVGVSACVCERDRNREKWRYVGVAEMPVCAFSKNKRVIYVFHWDYLQSSSGMHLDNTQRARVD